MNTTTMALFSIIFSIVGIAAVMFVPVSLVIIVVYLIKIYNMLKSLKKGDNS